MRLFMFCVLVCDIALNLMFLLEMYRRIGIV